MPKWLENGGQFHSREATYSASQIDSGELESNLLKTASKLDYNADKLKDYAPIKTTAYTAKAEEIRKLANSVTSSRIAYEASLKAVVDFNWTTSIVE